MPTSWSGQGLRTTDPVNGFRVDVTVTPRLTIPATPALPYNRPGHIVRDAARSPAVMQTERVRPRRLGHVVIGTVDKEASQRFFVDGLGFKLSDNVPGRAAFMRCSTDHHNLLVQQAPMGFLHHTAWEVDDVDEVGRGATAMLKGHPERHIWGLGRHFLGSNFFWYLKDPAGSFSEYYSDMDCVVTDALWTVEEISGLPGLYSWGPPPSFILPEDIAAAMVGAHQPS